MKEGTFIFIGISTVEEFLKENILSLAQENGVTFNDIAINNYFQYMTPYLYNGEKFRNTYGACYWKIFIQVPRMKTGF